MQVPDLGHELYHMARLFSAYAAPRTLYDHDSYRDDTIARARADRAANRIGPDHSIRVRSMTEAGVRLLTSIRC